MRFLEVSVCDPTNDGGHEWNVAAERLPEDALNLILCDLYGRGYDTCSIDVRDLATGHPVPDEEWPAPWFTRAPVGGDEGRG